MKKHNASLKFDTKKIAMFILMIGSLSVKAELAINETRREQTTQSPAIASEENSSENNKTPENMQKEGPSEEKKEVPFEVESQKNTVYKDSYDVEQIPSSAAKIFQLSLKKDNQVISNKYYYASGRPVGLNIKLTKGYGDYTLTYIEYDDATIFRKKIAQKEYAISYKKTVSNFRPKVTPNVQADHPEIVILSMQITQNANSEFEKMKAINAWMAQHITYNSSPISYRQKNDAVTTLENKTAICIGYANLFAAFARAAGLETKVMTGKGKTGGKSYYHQWNEVKVDNEWYFIDTTWNAGSKDQERFISKASQYPSSHYRAIEVKAL